MADLQDVRAHPERGGGGALIEKGTLEHVAKLARLALNEEEKERFLPELDQILEAFGKLGEPERESAASLHPVSIEDVLREDVPRLEQPTPPLRPEELYRDFLRGPKVP